MVEWPANGCIRPFLRATEATWCGRAAVKCMCTHGSSKLDKHRSYTFAFPTPSIPWRTGRLALRSSWPWRSSRACAMRSCRRLLAVRLPWPPPEAWSPCWARRRPMLTRSMMRRRSCRRRPTPSCRDRRRCGEEAVGVVVPLPAEIADDAARKLSEFVLPLPAEIADDAAKKLSESPTPS